MRGCCRLSATVFCLAVFAHAQSFQPGVLYPAQNGTLAVATADFNGDHKLDLAIGNASSSSISLFLGKGDGSFGAPTVLNIPGGCLVTHLEAADFSGDGKVDLLAACGFQQTIWFFPGQGTGQFGAGVASTTAPLYILDGFAEGFFRGVATADFNGDGKPDLAVSLSNNDLSVTDVAVMFGNGNGTFQTPSVVFNGLPGALSAADMDGDGKPDLVIAESRIVNGQNSQIVVLHSDGKGGFRTAGTAALNSEALLGGFTIADVNRDGIPDVVGGGVDSGIANNSALLSDLAVLLGKGDGTLKQSFFTTESGLTIPLAVADFRGTGVPDLIEFQATELSFAQGDQVALFYRKGNGDGTFQPPAAFPIPGGAAPWWGASLAADFNGDGLPDFAFLSLPSLFNLANTLNGDSGSGSLSDIAALLRQAFGPGSAVVMLNSGAPPPQIAVSITQLQFSYMGGSSAPSAQAIAISNARTGALSWTAASTASWLTVSPASGTASTPLTVSVAAGLAANTYTGSVVIASAGASNTPVTIPVTLVVAPATVGPNITSVVNGASFQPGFESGSWVTVKGTNLANTNPGRIWTAQEVADGLPTALDGVSVTIDGKAAYVYYISPTQINVQAPTDSALGTVNVVVKNNANSSPPFPATLQQFAPAFFQYQPSPYAIASRFPDYALIGNPSVVNGTVAAKPGDILILWATGFGPTTPVTLAGIAVTGAPAVASAPAVTVGGAPVTYISAVLTAQAAGLYQIAIQLPANVPTGVVAVQATVNGVSTPTGVDLFIAK